MIPNEIRSSVRLCCSALNENGVEYMIIGGVAVAFYGYHRISGAGYGQPEITHDIDFWYNPTTDNYYKLLDTLTSLKIDTSSLTNTIFDPKHSYLRIPMDSFKMEFLPQMIGLDSFQKCVARTKSINVDGESIPFIGYSDLLLNKKAINRPIDKQDILELTKRNQKK